MFRVVLNRVIFSALTDKTPLNYLTNQSILGACHDQDFTWGWPRWGRNTCRLAKGAMPKLARKMLHVELGPPQGWQYLIRKCRQEGLVSLAGPTRSRGVKDDVGEYIIEPLWLRQRRRVKFGCQLLSLGVWDCAMIMNFHQPVINYVKK